MSEGLAEVMLLSVGYLSTERPVIVWHPKVCAYFGIAILEEKVYFLYTVLHFTYILCQMYWEAEKCQEKSIVYCWVRSGLLFWKWAEDSYRGAVLRLRRRSHNCWGLGATRTRLLLSPQFFLFLQNFLICQHGPLCVTIAWSSRLRNRRSTFSNGRCLYK